MYAWRSADETFGLATSASARCCVAWTSNLAKTPWRVYSRLLTAISATPKIAETWPEAAAPLFPGVDRLEGAAGGVIVSL